MDTFKNKWAMCDKIRVSDILSNLKVCGSNENFVTFSLMITQVVRVIMYAEVVIMKRYDTK